MLWVVSGVAYGQHLLSIGIKGGVPATDPISETTFNGVDTIVHAFSDAKNYVIGPLVQLNLPLGFAVEADALYRPLNLTTDTRVLPLTAFTRISEDIHSMEFPILLKYHFLPVPVVKPYAEAGPIFRYVGARGSYFSKSGFALGAGVDLKLLVVRIEPELRYTHWGADSGSRMSVFGLPPSNQNQAEFLIGLIF